MTPPPPQTTEGEKTMTEADWLRPVKELEIADAVNIASCEVIWIEPRNSDARRRIYYRGGSNRDYLFSDYFNDDGTSLCGTYGQCIRPRASPPPEAEAVKLPSGEVAGVGAITPAGCRPRNI